MNALSLLKEIQSLYFTDTDEVKSATEITIETIIDLKIKLINVELEEGFTAQTETIESYINALENSFQ
ncbi:hypothetical protein [Chryseobacterium koreense]|jgi:hypothetical protein|uniref:Uncharacterized protein n=1 Tax=Chryseobacterium koreense CCUG 49689 TaxID=1304281 RepID=A0A0J7IXM4_9FLAO|nr:hypothetical protein [Chryseobacterium koreense]KMQ70742.1 hypothetical protein ACM44_10510 [Chryseobacterium koreense CCUG 49689]MBB5333634.1 hypothetical protein [Chryseobacterium koreense]